MDQDSVKKLEDLIMRTPFAEELKQTFRDLLQRGELPKLLPVYERPLWEHYFMQFAKLAATRTTCMRRAVGAVFVRDKQILTTGYNGAPRGLMHCKETGCMRADLKIPSGERQELCRGLHAEQNAIIQAARTGISIQGSILYGTTRPCSICARMLINAGIEKIYYLYGYEDKISDKLLTEANIPLIHMK